MSDPTPDKADETTDLREALIEMAVGTRDLAREAQATADHFRPDFDACRVDGKFPDKAASDRSLRLYCFTINRERDAKRLTSEAETLERAVALIAAHAAEIQALRADSASMSSLVRQATAEIMRVELERDGCASLAGSALAENMIVRFLNDRLAAENAVLKAALQPFADWIDALEPEFADHEDDVIAGGVCRAVVTFGDLRAARAALPEAITPKETSDVQN